MDAVHGLDLSQPPFDLLDDAGRARLSARVDMGYHARGQVIIAGSVAQSGAISAFSNRAGQSAAP